MLKTAMSMRAHHAAALLFVGAVVLATSTWLAVHAPVARATCGTGGVASVVITSPSSTAGPLIGPQTLRAYSSPVSSTTGLTFMIVSPSQIPLGQATLNGSMWELNWDSRNVPNGAYQLVAVGHAGSTVYDCASASTAFTVQNQPSQSPTLSATITPGNWSTTVGTSRTFALDTIYTDQYGRLSHVDPTSSSPQIWHTTIGTLSTTGGVSTVLYAGTSPGSGTLGAEVQYQGLSAHALAPVSVAATTSGSGSTNQPTPTPTPTASPAPGSNSGPGGTSGGGTIDPTLATMPTIFRPAAPTNTKPVVDLSTLSCMQQAVGKERFDEISSGQSEPTAAEKQLLAQCFSGPEKIPGVLAPVTPTKVNELTAQDDLVKVDGLKNTTVTNTDGKTITGLQITGTGTPNSDVFIYVFSDPLVLRAQTDSKGAWSYVLETPLQPGKHEIYAVAAKDSSTFVRSSAVPVSIAAAAADSQAGSLVIEQGWSAAQVGFVALAGLMVVAAVVILLVVRRRGRASQPVPAEASPALAPAPAMSTAGLVMPTGTPVAPPIPPAPSPAAGPIDPPNHEAQG
ncbi:MAG TPA: hypothetical protein VLF67_01895 [Candidatus Saccharimonas sp.]|nr:hypothetical protein [Candidatus Saccharimonas sp.]